MFSKNENRVLFSVFVVGFTTIISQIVLLRNFLSVFGGIELIIGIVFSNWLLITALGAYIGRLLNVHKADFRIFFVAHVLLGLFPILIAFLIIFLRNHVFPAGIMINPMQMLIGSFVLLLPFCLISGILFSLFGVVYSSERKSNDIFKIYGIEALGAIAGGTLFNFGLIFITNSFVILKILLILNFCIALFIYFIGTKKRIPWVVGIVVFVVGGIITYYDLEQTALKSYFKNQALIETYENQYGSIAVTQTSEQINFYENGVLLFSSDNVIANEENVHYAMLQHSNPKNVLLISGGIAGTINEILKYNVELVDYLELDQGLVKLGLRYGESINDDERIRIINKDIKLFLKQTNKLYDVVLINMPDPVNARINRVYTLEFFEELKKKTTSSGVVSTSISGSTNYMSKDSRQLHNTLYSTMKLVFNNLLIIPGHRNYFIASDHLLSARISELASRHNVSNKYINPHYIDDDLISERIKQIENNLFEKAVINYDFTPAVYLFQLKIWLSKFNKHHIYFILLGAIIILLITRFNVVNQGLIVTGFSATSLELLIIISFQVIYGYVYFMMGIFITIFMGGVVLGNLYLFHKVKVNYRNYSAIQYSMGMISIIIPLILMLINSISVSDIFIHIIFIMFIGGIGLITGLQFSLATKLHTASLQEIASGTYGADSMGSAFGALITAALLIPFFGLFKVCLIIGILNFITGLYILLRMKKK